MIERALLPHAGAMVLLDELDRWDSHQIVCFARSHLDPANPLRRNARLAAVCGVEYAMQAAALHGALRAGLAQPAGYIASLRAVSLQTEFLDGPASTLLRIEARLEVEEQFGLLYTFTVATTEDSPLLSGQATIALPRAAERGPE